MIMRKGIELAVKAAVDEIKAISKEVDSKEYRSGGSLFLLMTRKSEA